MTSGKIKVANAMDTPSQREPAERELAAASRDRVDNRVSARIHAPSTTTAMPGQNVDAQIERMVRQEANATPDAIGQTRDGDGMTNDQLRDAMEGRRQELELKHIASTVYDPGAGGNAGSDANGQQHAADARSGHRDRRRTQHDGTRCVPSARAEKAGTDHRPYRQRRRTTTITERAKPMSEPTTASPGQNATPPWPSENAEHGKLKALMHAMIRCDEILPDVPIIAGGAVTTAWRAGATQQELALLAGDLEAAANEAAGRGIGAEATEAFDKLTEGILEQHLSRICYKTRDAATARARLDACDDLWPANRYQPPAPEQAPHAEAH